MVAEPLGCGRGRFEVDPIVFGARFTFGIETQIGFGFGFGPPTGLSESCCMHLDCLNSAFC